MFNLDFIHGYWQLPFSADSRDCQSFGTPFGVFKRTGVINGANNAVAYLKSLMELMFGHLDFLIYLDDFLGSASNERLIRQASRRIRLMLGKGFEIER